LAYFISLPATVADNKRNRGIIELFLTLTAESTNSAHPAHDFIKNRYNRVVDSAARQLREARDEGQTRAMEDTEIEWQIRTLYSMMDGIQLQWLIDPELDSVPIFTHALNAILRDWTGRDNVALSADQTADPACAVQPVMAD
jgi:hypothetical protein